MTRLLDDHIAWGAIEPGENHDMACPVKPVETGAIGRIDLDRCRQSTLPRLAHVLRAVLAARPRRADTADEDNPPVTGLHGRVEAEFHFTFALFRHGSPTLNTCGIFCAGNDIG